MLFAGAGVPGPAGTPDEVRDEVRKYHLYRSRTLPEQGGLFGAPVVGAPVVGAPVVATPITPVVATPVGDEDEDELDAAPTPPSPQRQLPLPLSDAACDIKMVNGLAK